MQKAILGTGRPLTIACHMKIFPEFNIRLQYYFAGLIPVVSVGAIVVSTGDIVVEVSTVEVESPIGAPPSVVSLHATNALIARTNKNFFICN